MTRGCFTVLAILLLASAAHGRELPRSTSGSRCDSCLLAFQVLDDVLSDAAVVNALITYVETNVCTALPKEDKCRNLAEGLLPVALQWLRTPATRWQFCRAAGECKQQEVPQQIAKVDDASQCAACTLVVFQVQQLLNNTETLQKLNETAQQGCALLPEDFKATCVSLVNQYEPVVLHFITQARPDEVCKLVGMCDAQRQVAGGEGVDAAARAMHCKRAMEASMRLRGSASANRLGDTCDYCKLAVIEAHSLVANPQVQSAMINYTKSLCESSPSFKDTCELYVDTYAPVVFSLLTQYLASPDALCAQIGICPPPPPRLSEVLVAALRGNSGQGLILGRAAVGQHF